VAFENSFGPATLVFTTSLPKQNTPNKIPLAMQANPTQKAKRETVHSERRVVQGYSRDA